MGRAEEGCAKFGGSAVGWSATAGVLAARGDVVGGAKGSGIGIVGGRLSGAVTSAVEGSTLAAGFLIIRSPTSGAGAVSVARIEVFLGACATGACSLIAVSASWAGAVGRVWATADKEFS